MIIPTCAYLIPSKKDVRLSVCFDENPVESNYGYEKANEMVITPAVGVLWQKPPSSSDARVAHPYYMDSASSEVKVNVSIPKDRIRDVLLNPLTPYKDTFLNRIGSAYDIPCMTWYDNSSYVNGTGFVMSRAQDLFGSDRLFGDTSFCMRLLYKTSQSSVSSIKGSYVVFGFGEYFQWLGGSTSSLIIYDFNTSSTGWKSVSVTHSKFSTGWVGMEVAYKADTKQVFFYAHGKLVYTFDISSWKKMDLTGKVETFYFGKSSGNSGVKTSIADICIWAGEHEKKDTYVIQTNGVEITGYDNNSNA